MSQELDMKSSFALDEIIKSGLKTAVSKDVVFFNYDSRIITDPGMSFYGYAIWRFSKKTNIMNFCYSLYCSDPISFDYIINSNEICFNNTEKEISGCYSLTTNNNHLEWHHKGSESVMTTFSAFTFDSLYELEQIWKVYNEQLETEVKLFDKHRKKIVSGLISQGFLKPNHKNYSDVSIRIAIVSFQRKNNIFPIGFVDKTTITELLKSR